MSNPGQIIDPDVEVFVPSGWGAPKPTKVLNLPSGAKVRIKELDVPDLLRLGVLDVIDTFSKKVLPKKPGKQKGDENEKIGQKLLRNPEQMGSMLVVIDKIVAESVVEPKCYVKEEDEELDPTKLYAHLIPFEDRMEVFQNAAVSLEDYFQPGGEQASAVGTVEKVESVQLPPVAPDGDKGTE